MPSKAIAIAEAVRRGWRASYHVAKGIVHIADWSRARRERVRRRKADRECDRAGGEVAGGDRGRDEK